jgi:hypothetical protein
VTARALKSGVSVCLSVCLFICVFMFSSHLCALLSNVIARVDREFLDSRNGKLYHVESYGTRPRDKSLRFRCYFIRVREFWV